MQICPQCVIFAGYCCPWVVISVPRGDEDDDPISVERSVNRKYRATPIDVTTRRAWERGQMTSRHASKQSMMKVAREKIQRRQTRRRQLYDDVTNNTRRRSMSHNVDVSRKLYLKVEFVK